MNEVLAKSNGTSLANHSKLVGLFARTIASKKYIQNDEVLFSEIEVSGFLHDIAKVIEKNQESIKKNKKMPIKPTAHNEQGWAFLSKHLQCKSSSKKNVLYNVYWHHGTANYQKVSNNVIYDNIDSKDIEKLILIVKELLKDNPYFSCSDEPLSFSPIFRPDFYQIEDEFESSIETFSRMCLVSADRMVSGFTPKKCDYFLENSNKISDYIDDLMKISECDNINNIHFDNERFEIQKNLATEEAKTICFNGPAGFGKTNAGLFWITKNKEKTIWVCPRNTVAYSVYHSLIETFEKFKIEGISVELYLTGKVQKKNTVDTEDFSSDIIVTNIDNFLTPSIDNRNAKRLFYTINTNVIFDEYHEYVTTNNNILLSCFINIMKTRHRNTQSRTLLISGTPIYEIEELWDYDSNKTAYLPNKYQHFPSAHDNPYFISVENNIPHVDDNKNSIIFLNAISSTQDFKIKYPDTEIFHGDFEKWYKDHKLSQLFINNGKNSPVTISKQNVVSTHALQASADLSFSSLYESVVSPMATLQRIGRTNRWGEFDSADFFVFNLKNNSETHIKNILYNGKLCQKWFEVLLENDKKQLTLSQIYKLYNDFCQTNKSEIKKYIRKCYSDSILLLEGIYPTQSDIKEEEEEIQNKIFKSDSNKIRSNGNQIFCIYKIKNSDRFTEPFNENVFGGDFKKTFGEPEDKKIMNKIKNAMKNIIRSEQNGLYDYTLLVDSGYIDEIRKAGKYSNTPYIVFNKEYDLELGLVKINLK